MSFNLYKFIKNLFYDEIDFTNDLMRKKYGINYDFIQFQKLSKYNSKDSHGRYCKYRFNYRDDCEKKIHYIYDGYNEPIFYGFYDKEKAISYCKKIYLIDVIREDKIKLLLE